MQVLTQLKQVHVDSSNGLMHCSRDSLVQDPGPDAHSNKGKDSSPWTGYVVHIKAHVIFDGMGG